MELDIRLQALRLLLALCLGAAGGLLYDLLRPPRWKLGRAASLLLDLLYCLIMGACAFAFALSAPNGRLGQWELSAALVGFLTYLYLLSPLCLPIFAETEKVISKFCVIAKEKIKKGAKDAKKFFQKFKGCFII